MADAKITALTENITPLGTDIIPMVDDPAGTPVTKKMTLTNLGVIDGWVNHTAYTWAFGTASTFTIAGVDLTNVFIKGTRIRFKQGAGYKYAVVKSSTFSTDTTVTIYVNTDYTIANAAITNNYYSYDVNPQGFPGAFSFTPTLTSGGGAFTNAPTVSTAKWQVIGNVVVYSIQITYHATSGGSGDTNLTSIPVPFLTDGVGNVQGRDWSNGNLVSGFIEVNTIHISKYDGTTIIANSRSVYCQSIGQI